MAITGKFIFTASMDVDPAKEDLFNEVYDKEHIPNLLKVRGLWRRHASSIRILPSTWLARSRRSVSRTSRSIRRTMKLRALTY